MLDPWVRGWIDHPLDALGRRLGGLGLRPDALTLVGFAFGMGAALAAALEAFAAAAALLALNRVLDGLDGAVARAVGTSDRGAFLDIALDFLVYAALPLGFAFADPQTNALWAAVLLFTFIGTASSFLAFAIFAQKHGLVTRQRGRKTFFYLGGLAEGTETTAVLLAMCLFPGWFPWLAGGFAAICGVTTLSRIAEGATTLARHRD